jgi:hypothetical protein
VVHQCSDISTHFAQLDRSTKRGDALVDVLDNAWVLDDGDGARGDGQPRRVLVLVAYVASVLFVVHGDWAGQRMVWSVAASSGGRDLVIFRGDSNYRIMSQRGSRQLCSRPSPLLLSFTALPQSLRGVCLQRRPGCSGVSPCRRGWARAHQCCFATERLVRITSITPCWQACL